MTKLMGLQYKIVYKQGSANQVVDALSRVPSTPTTEVLSLSVAQTPWLQDLQASYNLNEKAQELLSKLSLGGSTKGFSLVKGIIKYKDRI